MPRASAQIDIIARDSRFNRAMSRVISTLDRVRQRMQSVSRAARRMLLVAGAAATGLLLRFGAFEQKMARVKALTTATEEEFRKLVKTAKVLGATTQFTAVQAAEAMAEFALQGFSASQIMIALRSTLSLATAGMLDVKSAAKISAGIMKGMKLEVRELSRVVDVLAAATTTSATEVADLGEAMRALGPIAAKSGLSLEETVAVLQAFADVTIKGSLGGTALRNILLRLQSGTPAITKVMKTLGIEIADSDGKLKSFADIIDVVNASLRRLDPISQSAATTALAGVRASAAFTEVLSLGSKVIRQYTRDLENAAGVAKRIAEIELDTLTGSFILLTSAIDGVAIALGQELGRRVRPLIDSLTALFTTINKMDESTKRLVISLGLAAAAIAALLVGFPALLLVLKLAAISAAVFGTALIALGGPVVVGAIVGTIGLLGKMKDAIVEAATALELVQGSLLQMAANTNAVLSQMKKAREALKDAVGTKERIAGLERMIQLEKGLIAAINTEARIQQNESVFPPDRGKEALRFAGNQERKAKERISLLEKQLFIQRELAALPRDSRVASAVRGAVRSLVDLLNRLGKAQHELAKAEEKKLAILKREAERIRESNLTAQERLTRELALLKVLREKGLLTAEEAKREEARARKAAKGPEDLRGGGGLESVSAVFRRIQSAAGRVKTKDPGLQFWKNTANNTKASLAIQKLIEKGIAALRGVIERLNPQGAGIFGP